MLWRPSALSTFLTLVSACSLQAVIVNGIDGSRNTLPPATDDFGFANVGKVFGLSFNDFASGVYLGNGWVITGYHVVRDNANSGAFQFGSVVFNGQTYQADPSTAIRLTTPVYGAADLALFRLTTVPNLPSVTISATAPVANSVLLMAGAGRNRATAETHWTVNTATNPDTWQVTAGTGNRQGYLYAAGGGTVRWGRNQRTTSLIPNLDDGAGVTQVFRTQFDNDASALTDEAQGAPGDSGGGVFYKNITRWELSGIMLTIDSLDGQPAESAVFGSGSLLAGDHTYIADLSLYRSQILNIIPEPGTALLLLGSTFLLTRRNRFVRK